MKRDVRKLFLDQAAIDQQKAAVEQQRVIAELSLSMARTMELMAQAALEHAKNSGVAYFPAVRDAKAGE